MNHVLKIEPHFFQAVIDGDKTYEIRQNDRGFCSGHTVELQEYQDGFGYTGRSFKATIGYLTNYCQSGNYVVFSLLPPFHYQG